MQRRLSSPGCRSGRRVHRGKRDGRPAVAGVAQPRVMGRGAGPGGRGGAAAGIGGAAAEYSGEQQQRWQHQNRGAGLTSEQGFRCGGICVRTRLQTRIA